jgi:polyferredoxin
MSTPAVADRPGFDLLRVPLLGTLLRWRHVRLLLQLPLFALAVVLVLHGLYGPDLAPKNLATLLTWVHYRGLLVLVLLAAGNFFCLACPLLLARDVARRWFRPPLTWPRWLRNKWLAVGLFVLILFSYELFSLWETPAGTAALLLGYFAAAFVVDALFRHAAFCKWVCPIGQFNFVASTLSPLEVQVRDPAVCSGCQTKDCIRGTAAPAEAGRRHALRVVQRGCELALFVPRKVGNLDCTLCMDCVHACPHDNIAVAARLPGSELWVEGPRSGAGEPHRRPDLAALAVVFTFGALVNAFGMVSPVYAFMRWLHERTGISSRAGLLGTLFFLALVVEPVVLLGLAALAMRWLTGDRRGPLALVTRYAASLVPLGFGVWLAHYAFHFLTGILTVVPVAQNALVELGVTALGRPRWQLGGLPERFVYPLELGLLGLGLVGSWLVAWRLASRDAPAQPAQAFSPWAVLHLLMALVAVWLLSQPMEMRGTFLGG